MAIKLKASYPPTILSVSGESDNFKSSDYDKTNGLKIEIDEQNVFQSIQNCRTLEEKGINNFVIEFK